MLKMSCLCLGLTAALLTGCSNDPEPREPRGSATTEPTATPPPLPEAATHETADGAAAFVDHYLDVLNYAAHTGDTAALAALAHAECEGCRDYQAHYDRRTAAGGRLIDGEFSIASMKSDTYGPDFVHSVELRIAAGEVAETSGSELESFESTTEAVTFVTTYADGNWQMLQFVPAVSQ